MRAGGGPATLRQYLRARLVDELHLAIIPNLLGSPAVADVALARKSGLRADLVSLHVAAQAGVHGGYP